MVEYAGLKALVEMAGAKTWKQQLQKRYLEQ
jgi:hypothetical protein